MYLFVIILVLIIYSIMKVKIKIINILDETDVIIQLGLIKIHIDYDMFVKELNKIAKKTKFNLKQIKEGVGFYKIGKNIIRNSNVVINELNVVKKTNEIDIFNIYLNISYYTLSNYIKSYLIHNTRRQNNISFYIKPDLNNDLDLKINFQFSLSLLIINLLLNIKNIIKIKKDMI